MSERAKVRIMAGMAVVAGRIAPIPSEKGGVAPRLLDPVVPDWNELSWPDSWGVPCVYDFGAYRLLAGELERWAKHFGGTHGQELRRRAAWLLSDKVPGADS